MVENEDRPKLPNGSSAETSSPRRLQNRFLVEVVAAEHLIDLAEDAIILEKRRHAVAGGSNRTANIDDIAEITGVA